MRDMEVTLGDKKLKLAATFAASMKIAKTVADPLLIAREAMVEYMFMEQGISHNPRWSFTVQNIPQILHIGAEAAGENYTLEQIQEIVFDYGFADSRTVATDYLSLIVGPAPEEEIEEQEKSEGK